MQSIWSHGALKVHKSRWIFGDWNGLETSHSSLTGFQPSLLRIAVDLGLQNQGLPTRLASKSNDAESLGTAIAPGFAAA